MDKKTVILPVQLSNGKVIHVQATDLSAERAVSSKGIGTTIEDISAHIHSFDGITSVIENISTGITESLKKAKPTRATVEFGLEVAVESGNITSLLVNGSGKATLQITLEWSGTDS